MAAAAPSNAQEIHKDKNHEPIVVHDKNDRRLKEYQDSLYIYNEALKVKPDAPISGHGHVQTNEIVREVPYGSDDMRSAAEGLNYQRFYQDEKVDKISKKIKPEKIEQSKMNPLIHTGPRHSSDNGYKSQVPVYRKPIQKVAYENPKQEIQNLEIKIVELKNKERNQKLELLKPDVETVQKTYPVYIDPSDSINPGHVKGYEKVTYDKKTGKMIHKEYIPLKK